MALRPLYFQIGLLLLGLFFLSLHTCPTSFSYSLSLGGKGEKEEEEPSQANEPEEEEETTFFGVELRDSPMCLKNRPMREPGEIPQRRMSAQTSSDDDTGPLFPPLRTGRLRAPPPPPFLSLQLAKPLSSSSSSSPHPSSTHQSSTHFCPPGFFPPAGGIRRRDESSPYYIFEFAPISIPR